MTDRQRAVIIARDRRLRFWQWRSHLTRKTFIRLYRQRIDAEIVRRRLTRGL